MDLPIELNKIMKNKKCRIPIKSNEGIDFSFAFKAPISASNF